MKIDGREIARGILERLKNEAKPRKFLAVVTVGDDAAMQSFVREKERAAKTLGVDLRRYVFPAEISQDELRREVLNIAQHKTCGVVVVQLPLPQYLNQQYVLNAVPAEKDVDVLGERALGAFYAGRNPVDPPAIETVKVLLEATGRENLQSAHVVVLGAGMLVGRPISVWLLGKAGTLSVLDKHTHKEDVKKHLGEADIVVSGTGIGGFLGAGDLKEGALVLDFGYDTSSGKLQGDFSPLEEGNKKNIIYTPTPGGTGPILVAKLFENFFRLAKDRV